MTTAEIKAPVEQLKQHNWPSDLDCIAAIETLLARQADALAIQPGFGAFDAIRAILNPENET